MKERLAGFSLRQRLLGLGLAGVIGALLVGGLLLYAAMTATLNRTVAQEAKASAADVAALVDAGRLPDPVPVTRAQVVQVMDADERVVAGSATADRLNPLVSPAERAALLRGETITVPGSRAALSGDLTVAGAEGGPGSARLLVVAAVPTADLDVSRSVLRRLILVFFPVVAFLLFLIAWQVIGAALAPVEQLRNTAERIGDSAAEEERLPVPESRDEIRALAETLNGMLDRLASARRTQRSFVADAAHELRSPLATMRTQLEVAQRIGDGGRLPDDLLPQVQRLGGLVEDLLTLARSDDAPSVTVRAAVDLAELADAVSARRAQGRVPVTVSVTGTGPVTVTAAYDDIFRAVSNLVDNAVRHARSRVCIEVAKTGQAAEVVISDDGHGIDEPDRERVFDRFTRLDEARARDTGGSGLGLAITRELLRRNDSSVSLEDADPGVRAVVRMPLSRS